MFYPLETDASQLLQPAEWIGTRGFTFNGGLILAPAAIAWYLRRRRLTLDAIAAAFPLGVAIGRIGDVINGEHYGPATDFFLGVRNVHPDAGVPSATVAYHSGASTKSCWQPRSLRSSGRCVTVCTAR
ncbi:MAG: prolipoprotein diacylglyceryl transferase [Solirubrobacterales bacterium]|nr:prolipoprotein diacylglyceryl transferase [Solirubrobacterales bacterium]